MKKLLSMTLALLILSLAIVLLGFDPKPMSARVPIEDGTVVWDKQVQNGHAYLLVRHLIGFQDIMEGVMLFRYPNELDQTLDKYDGQYKIFDIGVDDMVIDPKTSQSIPRAVRCAKLDLKGKKVTVAFDIGSGQTLDISAYDLKVPSNQSLQPTPTTGRHRINPKVTQHPCHLNKS